MGTATLEIFVAREFPELPKVYSDSLLPDKQPMFWLTEHGYELYRAILARKNQLTALAATFQPKLWQRVYKALDDLFDEGWDEPRTLDTLFKKGIKQLNFTMGRVEFNIPIKAQKPAYKERFQQFRAFLAIQELLGQTEEFRTKSRERWVSPSNEVYINLTAIERFLSHSLVEKDYSFPKKITHTNMVAQKGLKEEFVAAGSIVLDARYLLTRGSSRDAELYWLFTTEATELDRRYIQPVKKMKKLTSLPPREELESETFELKDRIGALEASLQFRVYTVPNYRGLLNRINSLVQSVREQLIPQQSSPHSFRRATVDLAGTKFNVRFAKGVHGVYLSSRTCEELIQYALSQGNGKRVALHLSVQPVLRDSDLRAFFAP